MKINAFYDDRMVGYVDSYTFEEEEEYNTLMTSLFIYEDYRGRGFATALLWRLYDFFTEETGNKDIKYVVWTDCSDRCFHPDNLYRNVGAFYKEENDPEMIWPIRQEQIKEKRSSYTYPSGLTFCVIE